MDSPGSARFQVDLPTGPSSQAGPPPVPQATTADPGEIDGRLHTAIREPCRSANPERDAYRCAKPNRTNPSPDQDEVQLVFLF